MANDDGFQAQVRRLGELVNNLDKMPDSPQKAAGKELVQLLDGGTRPGSGADDRNDLRKP